MLNSMYLDYTIFYKLFILIICFWGQGTEEGMGSPADYMQLWLAWN